MDYIEINIEVLGQNQKAQVRGDLTIGELIEEIRLEFEKELPKARQYAIWVKGGHGALDSERLIAEVGRKLAFGTEREVPRLQPFRFTRTELTGMQSRKLGSHTGISLMVEDNGDELSVTWLPCIIGRYGQIPFENIQKIGLDINRYPDAEFISRDHAALLYRDGYFYIVRLRAENPAFLNEEEMEAEIAYPLQPSDRIILSKRYFVLVFNIS